MKITLLFNLRLLTFLFLVCLNSKSQSQTFERVEDIVGLGVLENNNGVAVADYDGDNDLDIFCNCYNKNV